MRKRFSLVLVYGLVVLPWLYSPAQAMAMQVPGWLLSSASLLILVLLLCRVRAVDGHSSLWGNDGSSNLAWHLVWAWLAASTTNAMIGVWQALGLLQFAEYGVVASTQMEAWGQLRQRNLLATLLALGLASALHAVGRRGHAAAGRRLEHGVWWAVLGLITCGLAATASRTGLIHVLIVGALFLLGPVRQREQRIMAFGAMLMFVLWSLLWPILRESNVGPGGVMQRLNQEAFEGRAALYANVLELVASSPWTGHGWRSLAYLHYSTDFSGPRFMEMLDNAHNLPLHLAVELGVPVALAFCGLVGWAIWRGRPWLEQRWDRQMAWAIVLVIGIHSMVEYPLWYGPFFMTMLIAIGILMADSWRKWYLALAKSTQYAIDLGVKMLAAVLLALVAYVAWDYHRVSQIYLPPEQRSSAYAQDPLAAAQKSVLFESHAQFAELQITPLTQASAPRILELSLHLVKWSPEPRIIEKLIESAVMLGQDDVAQFHIRRYRIAYPQAYAKWSRRLQLDTRGG